MDSRGGLLYTERATGRWGFEKISETSMPRAGIRAAVRRLELPANDEAWRGGKKGVDTRAGLPYTSPPLGNEGVAKTAWKGRQ